MQWDCFTLQNDLSGSVNLLLPCYDNNDDDDNNNNNNNFFLKKKITYLACMSV